MYVCLTLTGLLSRWLNHDGSDLQSLPLPHSLYLFSSLLSEHATIKILSPLFLCFSLFLSVDRGGPESCLRNCQKGTKERKRKGVEMLGSSWLIRDDSLTIVPTTDCRKKYWEAGPQCEHRLYWSLQMCKKVSKSVCLCSIHLEAGEFIRIRLIKRSFKDKLLLNWVHDSRQQVLQGCRRRVV